MIWDLKYGNGTNRYSWEIRREDMGGPAHPWGGGGRGGGRYMVEWVKQAAEEKHLLKLYRVHFFLSIAS